MGRENTLTFGLDVSITAKSGTLEIRTGRILTGSWGLRAKECREI